jgi:energy-coupling factor transporter ATP-binding protein EcfA2
MRINALDGQDGKILIAGNEYPQKNWTTVITGTNGSKKSLVLRLISTASLGYVGFVSSNHPKFRVNLIKSTIELPSQVIAISGTAFDRFPRQTLYSSSNNDNLIGGNYRYFGLKASNGVMSTVHSTKILGHALWNSRESLSERVQYFSPIFNCLSLTPKIALTLRRATSLNAPNKDPARPKLLRGSLDPTTVRPFLNAYVKKKSGTDDITTSYILQILEDPKCVRSLKKYLHQFPRKIEFDLSTGRYDLDFSEFDFDLKMLMDVGLITISDLLVSRIGDEHRQMSASDLSSGQWQMMLGILGLGLEVKSNSIVLIDEPENSLHPQWQRDYISILEATLKQVQGCHTIIATHSPLIASGISPSSGNIVRFTRKIGNFLDVESIAMPLVYGWDAREALESLFDMDTTRTTSFVAISDRALALIRDGHTATNEFSSLVEEITKIAKHLPENDPMAAIANAIATAASK